ncbi:ABC transporter permease [Larkinella sp. C7]|uniref:ABC transporter permease n=1 Tax=Larkinella sp. C7 TaxID=2576607 RepID=UPI0011111FD1|nr:ABC transporter permease [Larkinella sp. C7]
MMTLSYFVRSLSQERLKFKGTLVVWLALVAPVFVAVVAFMASYLDGHNLYQKGINPWLDYSGHILIGWTLFVFPIYVSLLSALVHAIEHQSNTWKTVYSLPMPKWSIYAAKLVLFTGLIVFSHLLLFGLAEAGGYLLGVLKPSYGFQLFSLHWVLAEGCFAGLLSGLGLCAIQFYIGLRFSSFIVPAGFGLMVTMAGAISRSLPISRFSPYLWPVSFFNRSIQVNNWQYGYVYIGMLTFLIGAIAGFQMISRRDVS